MKRIIHYFADTFAMSRSQVIGSFVLLFLILLLVVSYPFIERLFSGSDAEITIKTTQEIDSLSANLSQPSYESNYDRNFSGRDNEEAWAEREARPTKLFPFDPNVASGEALQSLGIPKGAVTNLLNYRAKGGRLRYKEDIQRIYFFPKDLYPTLAPYIQLPSRLDDAEEATPQAELQASIVAPTTAAASATSSPEMPARVAKLNNPATQSFDLNTADTSQLKLIKGLGSGYAARIVKYRESLGGFHAPEQVKTTYGLPPEVADELLRFSFIKKPVRKISINQITLENFTHPALKYHQKKAIIAYREQHGPFKSADDLRAIKVLDAESIQKIAPYLAY